MTKPELLPGVLQDEESNRTKVREALKLLNTPGSIEQFCNSLAASIRTESGCTPDEAMARAERVIGEVLTDLQGRIDMWRKSDGAVAKGRDETGEAAKKV